MTPAEASALREALALRQAMAARPGVTPEQLAAARAAVAARSQDGPARGATGRGTGDRPRAAASRAAARRRTATARRTARTGLRWSTRLGVVATSALLLPALLALVVPGGRAPEGAGHALDPGALALTARSSLLERADLYRQLERDADRRRAELDRARGVEDAVRARMSAGQQTVGAGAAQLYRAGSTARFPVFGLDVHRPDAATAVLFQQALADRAQEELESTVVRAQRTAAELDVAVDRVTDARALLAAAERRAADALTAVRAEVGDLSPEVAGRLAGLGSTPVAGAQQARNDAAVRRWQDYLGRLAAAGIEPPPVAALADLDDLPGGLSPALDADGRPIPGVAWAVIGNEPVTVLPAETVAAVSNALSQLGKPYVAGTAGPGTYDCGGFTAGTWLLAGYALPGAPEEQWATGTAVPLRDLQVGDLVFSPSRRDVGISLGGSDVIGASAETYRVGVRSMPADAVAVRVPLAAPAEANPVLPTTAVTGACGAPLPGPGPGRPEWGGWTNGHIPAEALCKLAVSRHALRCDAAASYAQLDAAYAAEFGTPLRVTDSYRSFGEQVAAYHRKPRLAAVPGTSNHGWALAIDLGGGVNVAGSPQWTWMSANAVRFGFVQPEWARPGGEKPEPWHWEYGFIS